ncbi:hypothetical protein FRC09_000533 [Ceratobasidium sp. 395]|nr:hypothetical protein FRC09_000533 [Ceratobasidium sp. 395]
MVNARLAPAAPAPAAPAPAAPAPAAPVSAASVASAPGSAPAQRGAQGITPIHVEFNICTRPKGTPGKDKFQLKEVLGLSSPVYSSILINVHDIGVAARLNMTETISKQNKYLLRKVYDTIIDYYPGLLKYENPYWVPEALTYVMLKSCVDRHKNNQRAVANPKNPKHSPKSLLKRQKARREAQRKSALDRAAARRAAKAAAALENPDESIEDMIKGMNNTTIDGDDDDVEMAIDGPLLPPDLTRTGKKTQPIESRDLAQAGPTATEPGANPIAASTPVRPKRFRPAVRPPPSEDVSVADPVSVPASNLVTSTAGSSPSAPTANSASAPAPDSAAAPESSAPAPAPKSATATAGSAPAPGSVSAPGPAHLLNPADADVAALLAAGKGAYCRVSADLLPLGSVDLFNDDGELSEATESDTNAKAKGTNGGAKSKSATTGKKGAATSKKGAAANKKAASTAKSATTSAAKGSGAKAKSQTQPQTATTARRTTRSSAKA